LLLLGALGLLAVLLPLWWLWPRPWGGEPAPDTCPADVLAAAAIPGAALAWPGRGNAKQAPPELVAIMGDGRFRILGDSGWLAYSPDGKVLAVPSGNEVRLFDAATGRYRRTLAGHTNQAYVLAFSPDGKTLASGGFDNTVRLWDPDTGKERHVLRGHQDRVFGLAFTPDGAALASAGLDRTVRLWKVATGEETLRRSHAEKASGVAVRPDGKLLASVSLDGIVRTWDLPGGKPVQTLEHGASGVLLRVAFSHDGKLLASGSEEAVKLWDGRTGAPLRSLPTPGSGLLAFSPDGDVLWTARHDHRGGTPHAARRWQVVTGKPLTNMPLLSIGGWANHALSPDSRTLAALATHDKVVRLYDTATGRPRFPATGHSDQILRVAFSHDGRLLATPSRDGTIRLWDVASARELRVLEGHTGEVLLVSFAPNDKLVASGGADGLIQLWDPAYGILEATLRGHTGIVDIVAFSPDGRLLASASRDGSVRLWDVERRTEVRTLKANAPPVWALAFSGDGRSLATGGSDRNLRLLDVRSGAELLVRQHPEQVTSLVILPDGRTLATGGGDGVVRLWSLAVGTLRQELPGRGGPLTGLSVSGDGRLLAASGLDGAVRVWDLEASPPRRQTFRLFPYRDQVFSVVFSPEGRHLATANPDGTVYLLRLAAPGRGPLPGLPTPDPTTAELRRFVGHRGHVDWTCFSRDGKLAFSAGTDETARVWDVAAGKELHALGHPARVIRLAATPDGRHLITTCADGLVRLWDVTAARELRRLDGKHDPWSLALSPDGNEVVTAVQDRPVTVVSSLATGKELRRFDLGGQCAFALGGKQLLSARSEHLRLADAARGAGVRRLGEHRDWVRDVAVSPDGRLALSASGNSNGFQPADPPWSDCSVRLWDLTTGRELWRRQESHYTRWGVAFTPDGRLAVAGSYDRTVRVYDVETGRELACLDTPTPIHGVAVAPDGRSVLTGGQDGVLRLYRLPKPRDGRAKR
jgi:WD40 repeat protein